MPMPSLVSPLDEMNNMPEAEAKPAAGAKRTVRSARKN
jgi:hypothetical protein